MKFAEVPFDIIDQILPLLPVESLLGLSETCRQFYVLCSADCVWRSRAITDFGLVSLVDHCPNGSYKQLYQDLDRALQTFAWGENSDRRLGFGDQYDPFRHMYMREICLPRELRSMRGRAIVTLVAGGRSFHALDRRGRVWMWGLMQPQMMDGQPRLVPQPCRVALPSTITAIASGKFHCVAADHGSGRVWHWPHGHPPTELVLNQPVQQIAAHRSFSTLLSSEGQIWSVSSQYPSHQQPTLLADPPAADPFTQIAAMLDHAVALTRSGRVFRVRLGVSSNDSDPEDGRTKIELDGFAAAVKDNGQPVALSAHLNSFGICTDQGRALIGAQHQQSDEQPLRIIDLPGQSIVKVVFGTHHHGALTSQGRMLTWGRHSSGALGRGFQGMAEAEDQGAEGPQWVDKLTDMFVIDAGFGANYSGCTAFPRELLQKMIRE